MFRFPPLTPFVKKLLIVLFGAYLVQIIVQNWVGIEVFSLLALDTGGLGLSTAWQVFTYVLAAPTTPNYVFSMLISLLFLWLMLAPFEQRFGPTRALQLCVVATLGAAVPAIVAGLLFSGAHPLFGAEALLLGTIAAFSWSYRGQGRMSFFGVIDMKPEHIIWLVLGISFLIFLTSGDLIGLVADLGAVGAGIGFIEWLRRPPTARRRAGRRKSKRSGGFRVISGDRDSGPQWLN